jgi:hypothetical protein
MIIRKKYKIMGIRESLAIDLLRDSTINRVQRVNYEQYRQATRV